MLILGFRLKFDLYACECVFLYATRTCLRMTCHDQLIPYMLHLRLSLDGYSRKQNISMAIFENTIVMTPSNGLIINFCINNIRVYSSQNVMYKYSQGFFEEL